MMVTTAIVLIMLLKLSTPDESLNLGNDKSLISIQKKLGDGELLWICNRPSYFASFDLSWSVNMSEKDSGRVRHIRT